jgi:hypothetical protein
MSLKRCNSDILDVISGFHKNSFAGFSKSVASLKSEFKSRYQFSDETFEMMDSSGKT